MDILVPILVIAVIALLMLCGKFFEDAEKLRRQVNAQIHPQSTVDALNETIATERRQFERQLSNLKEQSRALQKRVDEHTEMTEWFQKFVDVPETTVVGVAEGKYITMTIASNPSGAVRIAWSKEQHAQDLIVNCVRHDEGTRNDPTVVFTGLVMARNDVTDRVAAGRYIYVLSVCQRKKYSWTSDEKIEEVAYAITVFEPEPEPETVERPRLKRSRESRRLRHLKKRFKVKVQGLKAFAEMKQIAQEELASMPEEDRDFATAHLQGWVGELFEQGKI